MPNQVNTQYGISLPELLITIIIAAILIAIAIPSYKAYVSKTKISDALLLLDPYKIQATKLIMKTGTIPTTTAILYPDGNTAGYIDDNNKSISSFRSVQQISAHIVNGSILLGAKLTTDGTITATNNYLYIAYQNNKWLCGTSASKTNNIATKLLPSTCNNTLP